MNNIIPASRLSELLAAATGNAESGAFVKEFFGAISEALIKGEDVTVKGLGTFRLTGNPDKPVDFEQAAEFKAAVNSPFEAFEAMEVDQDEIADDEAAPAETPAPSIVPEPADMPPVPVVTETVVAEETVIPEPPAPPVVKHAVPEPPIPEPETVTVATVETVAEEPEPVEETMETEPESEPTPEPAYEPETEAEEEADNNGGKLPPGYHDFLTEHNRRVRRKQRFYVVAWLCVAFVIGILLGILLGFFFHSNLNKTLYGDVTVTQIITDTVYVNREAPAPAPKVEEPMKAVPDAAQQEPNATTAKVEEKAIQTSNNKAVVVKKEPVYDTVGPTTFLTTLARRHYGQMEYWVYIYKANPKLGNPNRIAPGTKLLIPDKSELPLTGNHDADVRAAKKLAGQIEAKYRK